MTEGGERNRELALRLLDELLNKGNEEAVLPLLSDDFLYHFHVREEPFRGHGTLLQVVRAWRNGFSDFHVEPQVALADDRHAAVWSIITGTHDGRWHAEPLPGFEGVPPSGMERIPPTGRRVEFDFNTVFAFADGKIASIRVMPDVGKIPVQLGVLPSATPPAFLIWLIRARLAARRLFGRR